MVRFSEGHVMFALRPAILALALGVLISPAVPTGESSPSVANRHEITACRLHPDTLQPRVSERPRSSGLAYFTPWKARPKMFLGERDQQLAEESDLGPVLVPGQHSSFASIASNSSRAPILSPLRC
jgi:hypothetical protein